MARKVPKAPPVAFGGRKASEEAVSALREVLGTSLPPAEMSEQIISALSAGYQPSQIAQSLGIPVAQIYALCSDPDAASRIAAAAAGIVVATLPASIAVQVELLGDQSPWVRLQAARQLVEIARGNKAEAEKAPTVLWDGMPKPGLPGTEAE